MITSLEALADLLTEAVADASCVPNVFVTAGRPAAPSDEGRECQTVIYVFGSNVADLNQDDQNACVVRSRWAMQYEIWTCYPEGWEDQIGTAAAETAVQCLYELMALAWCALVEAKDSGDPFGDCEYVELQPLETQQRLGQAISALGGVVVPYECPVPEVVESPSSP